VQPAEMPYDNITKKHFDHFFAILFQGFNENFIWIQA